MSRRVVVTGIGLVSPVGIGTADTWKAICAGQSGIAPITLFDASRHTTRFAGEVKGFDPLDWIEKKDVKKCARFIQFAIAATAMAMKESGLPITPENATRVGVSIGSGIGGFEVIEREHRTLLERGPDRVSPFFILSAIVNLAAGHVSVRYGAKGPNSAVATACTTGAHAIGDAYRLIQHGYADAMICGGAEASVTPLGVAGFASMRALSTRNDDPQRASRPWDKDRDGFVVGEGSGVLVIEERERALARGAVPIAEIVGYAMNADAHHLTAPPDDGDGVKRVMQLALDDARLEASRIQYLNAHATSTPLGDRGEAMAIASIFKGHTAALR
jgi:3-oxoacyl-[acyl-carrier-protein] synthase II